MSLNAPLFYLIPDETVRVAKAAFPKGNRYVQLRDTFGPLFHNADFQHLFSHTGQPGEDPARLAIITISSSPSACRMNKRPMPCGAGLTGNTC